MRCATLTRASAAPAPPLLDVGSSSEDIDSLYHHRQLELVRLAVLLVDEVPTAEDVVQDAFTAVYRRHGPRLRGLDNPRGTCTAVWSTRPARY
ncbi:hypothetical protein ACFY9G_37225 [Streptomyces anthocyanicus]|uniref:RNA polymerase sigma-70 region 2 domain-containing protein n=1 Tax=Streptomyces violaceolatus TaxID=67378 RepID=A0ABN3TBS7_9ACTN